MVFEMGTYFSHSSTSFTHGITFGIAGQAPEIQVGILKIVNLLD